MVRKSAPRPLKGGLVAGGEGDTKENTRHSAQQKRLKGGGFAVVAGVCSTCARGVGCGSGRVGAGLPRRLPPRARHRVVAFCCCVFSFCFLSGGYALPLGVAPCFLIVYAPAMRAVAYYALSGVVVASAPHGSERGIVSRAGGWRVHFVLL